MLDPIGGYEKIRDLLISQIETTQRISNPSLQALRKSLLADTNTLTNSPILEPVPRYQTSNYKLEDLLALEEENPLHDFSEAERSIFINLVLSGLFDGAPDNSNLTLSRKSLYKPYLHQMQMLAKGVKSGQPGVVTSGTGSGKTESFMFPILNHCYKTKDTKGIKAIIIYPMNALATDQAKRFAKTISKTPNLNGVRVGLYIGSSDDNAQKSMSEEYVITDKQTLCDNPPDILLTNYKMLDFMLMRPRDQKIWKHNIDTDVLKFIAVDEIHTFDGAQGTDLASLLRRVRAKLKVKKSSIACIGTSATLGGDTTEPIRNFASDISYFFRFSHIPI